MTYHASELSDPSQTTAGEELVVKFPKFPLIGLQKSLVVKGIALKQSSPFIDVPPPCVAQNVKLGLSASADK